jgi:hypothetical protein
MNGSIVFNTIINSSSVFQNGGQLILGQKVDDFTGIFEAEESFSGKITSFNVWDSILSQNNITSLSNCNCKIRYYSKKLCFNIKYMYICAQRPSLGPTNSGRCWQVIVVEKLFL